MNVQLCMHLLLLNYSVLRKATLLREEHGISKKILQSVDFYGFKKEWETIEELEEFEDDPLQLSLWCVMARERISQEIGFDIATDVIYKCKYMIIEGVPNHNTSFYAFRDLNFGRSMFALSTNAKHF